MLYWLHKPAYLPGTGNKPEKKENIMAETTKENKAQRAKKYRRRRVTAAVAAAAMCAVIGVGVNGVVTARANTALADALATAADLQQAQQESARQAQRESRTAAEANLTAYVAEASEEAEAALKKAAEDAAKAAAIKAAQTTNTSTNDSTELPGNGGKLSSGGRALAATKTGGNFKASVYTGNTGVSNLSYYQSLNSDVKAWLKIPGTNINYPVLQNASEDHYYLHRGLDRGQSYYGVLWTQTATRFGSGDSLSSNNVIYGHNWKNCRWNAAPSTYYAGQQMFESLLSYHYTSWAEQYPYIYYSTPSEEMAFVIFACFYTEGSDWYINAEGNIDGVISGAQSRSRHNFGVDVNSSDKLLTLSTCTRYYGNTDNQRFVVMARLLRPGGITLEQLRSVLGEVDVDRALYEKIGDDVKVSAPGMKYRHYAPKAPVTVVRGDPQDTAKYIAERISDATGVLCFDEYKNMFPNCIVECFGSQDDLGAQAREVFDRLRAFDDTAVTQIWAQCPSDEGLGLAVANRIKKAAGFSVIEI